MATQNPHDPQDGLDLATSARLAKLRSTPVDMSRLQQFVAREIPRRRTRLMLRPVLALAASIVLMIGGTLAFFAFSSRPAMASPVEMAQLYNDVVSGKASNMAVHSVDEANRMLASNDQAMPNMPAEQVMACCMSKVHNKRVACLVLNDQANPIIVTVTKAADMDMPDCQRSANGVNMIMSQRGGKAICVMGKVPVERLRQVAAEIK